MGTRLCAHPILKFFESPYDPEFLVFQQLERQLVDKLNYTGYEVPFSLW